ncbi:hypothetical protein EOW77_0032230 [Bradyrhizobium yuanmingense]|uniref:hypothetical protein n=1 Tax=Bradyrhizobium yuanmingense TaxID=108015 RepID=UPI000FE2C9C1|nr:hypothetical protein [Bradyrhizobium yuanmingense]TGN75938.1 hypothetical protein EOW77_0032230 [Bradyrhizobium yuanmingense]
MSTPLASPDDRLPTFAEVKSFDPVAAWDRLTPAQQRQIGILAVELGVVGGVLSYEHSHLTKDEAGEISNMESDLLTGFTAAIEPLWGQLYGWTIGWLRAAA